jgi:hypothetical protein
VARIWFGNDVLQLGAEFLTKIVDLIIKSDMSIEANETASADEKYVLAVALVYGCPTDLREFAASQGRDCSAGHGHISR